MQKVKSFFNLDSQTYNSKSLKQEILKNAISYLKSTARFDRPLINF